MFPKWINPDDFYNFFCSITIKLTFLDCLTVFIPLYLLLITIYKEKMAQKEFRLNKVMLAIVWRINHASHALPQI